MRKVIFLKLTLLLTFLIGAVRVFAQERIVPYSKVPSKIQTYIQQHFPQNNVLQAEYEYEGIRKEYDIILSDNIKLEFNGKNEIKKIDGQSKLPDSVIPNKIMEFIKTNYPNNFITEWELDRTKQSVELDNNLELEFTLRGDFLRIDN